MDQNPRLPSTTIMIYLVVLFFGLSVFNVACQSKSKLESESSIDSTPLVTEQGPTLQGSELRPITSLGENSWPRFSPDGKKILFSSRGRPSHEQAQIYELDLRKMKERRITHHDGDATSPVYSASSPRFFYASETDEVKEEALAIDRLIRTYRPDDRKASAPTVEKTEVAELYSQNLNGRELDRLTNARGFDGDLDIDATSKRIAFTSARNGRKQVFIGSLDLRQLQLVSGPEDIDQSPRFSADGKNLAWVRSSADGTKSQIMIMNLAEKKPKALTAGSSKDFDPFWSPKNDGELIFSSNRGGKSYNLYSITQDGACLKRLTQTDLDQTQASLSPDSKLLLFTGRSGDQKQIYAMPYMPPPDCESAESGRKSGS